MSIQIIKRTGISNIFNVSITAKHLSILLTFFTYYQGKATPTIVSSSITYNSGNPLPGGFGADGIEVQSPAVLTIDGLTLTMPAGKRIDIQVGAI